MTLPHVLCVDDEPRVLDGLRRVLRKSFEVETAGSGAEALARLDAGEAFEVVMSDMQMPMLNGAALLALFRARAPDTTRILLTGQADINSAIAAVNSGQIFRFLTKPCPPEDLTAALTAAVEQHRLISTEKVLLEQTLVGSVRALTEVLALVQPAIFGPAMRQHGLVRAVAEQLRVPDAWHLEVASMLSLVGYVVLPPDVATKLQQGTALDRVEADMARQVPAVVARVLACIPRLEKVRDTLTSYDALRLSKPLALNATLGAQILWAASELSSLHRQHSNHVQALRSLRDTGHHPTAVLDALELVTGGSELVLRQLNVDELADGMILAEEVKTQGGVLLMAGGQVVTEQLLQRIRNFHQRMGVVEPITCKVPREASAPAPPLRTAASD